MSAETNSIVMLFTALDMKQEPQSVTSHASTSDSNMLREPQDFSLVLGGPLFQLLAGRTCRATRWSWRGGASSSCRCSPGSRSCCSRLWKDSAGRSAAVPFLLDMEVHVRFLVAMPLLIAAELVVHRRMRLVVQQFLDRQLIPESAVTRFDAAIAADFGCATRCSPRCC